MAGSATRATVGGVLIATIVLAACGTQQAATNAQRLRAAAMMPPRSLMTAMNAAEDAVRTTSWLDDAIARMAAEREQTAASSGGQHARSSTRSTCCLA